MTKLAGWARRIEVKHLLILVGAAAVVVGTVRAFIDHNSTPVLIVGATLAVAALVSDRLTTAELSAGDKKTVLTFVKDASEQNASELRAAVEKANEATQSDLPEPAKSLLLDAIRRVEDVAERSDQHARLLESFGALYPPDSSLNRTIQASRLPMEMAILRATCTADALADGWRLTALVTAGPTPPFDLVCTVVMADGTPLRKNFPTVSVGNGVSLHFPADFGLARNQIHPGTIRVDWHAVYKGLIVNIDNLTIDIHPNSENGASDRNPPDI